MRMNKIITTIIMLLSTLGFAQDETAKKVLDKLAKKTEAYQNITIDFKFIWENKNQNIQKIEFGNLILEGKKFQLRMDNQIIINNGKTQWIYLIDMNELQIMDHDPRDNIISPNKIFTIYKEDYKYSYVGVDKNNDGEQQHIIELFPKVRNQFMKFNIAINASSNELERVTMHDKNGGIFSYMVESLKTNTELKPFNFETKEYQDIEVIDLR